MSRGVKARPLDRANPLPLWAQLEADIRRRVRSGAFDDRFPGEHELVAEYEVSRQTVRDALRRLREEGILESGRGRGTWLRKPRIEQPLGALYSLFRSVEALGLEQRSVVRVLDARVDEAVAARLGRAPGIELVHLERLRLIDGEPFALDRAWLPRSVAGPLLDADFTHSGIYDELLSLTGVRLTGGAEVISGVVPSPAERKLLKITSRTAALEVQRIGYLQNRAVEWRESLIRGDRFNVTTQWSTQEGMKMDVAGTGPGFRPGPEVPGRLTPG